MVRAAFQISYAKTATMPSTDKEWKDLSDAEKESAKVLGYGEVSSFRTEPLCREIDQWGE